MVTALNTHHPIPLLKHELVAKVGVPAEGFALCDLVTELRVCPLTGRHTRLTVERVKGAHLGENEWPDIADAVAESRRGCPFCPDVIDRTACTLDESRFGVKRFTRDEAVLFPNLAPYGPYSAVTVVGAEHYTEVGAYDPARYANAFSLSREYLQKVAATDESVRYAVITQNHLPASGGTLVNPICRCRPTPLRPGSVANCGKRR